MSIRLRALVVCLLATLSLNAQEQQILETKFGRLVEGDLERLPPPLDSAAEAYVLYDRYATHLDLNGANELVTVSEVHRRVKLLRPSSFGRADVALYYPIDGGAIDNLDALVHLPTGGVIKLKSGDFVKEKADDDTRVIKWTFPQVTEGAIIEYRYRRVSPNYLLLTRYFFQEDIPIRYGEYRATLPRTFRYINIGRATNFHFLEKETNFRNFLGRSTSIDVTTMGYYDMPAYKEQPNVNNFEDYLPSTNYQLMSYTDPSGAKTDIYSSWEETVRELHTRTDFGKAYTNRSFSGSAWKETEPLLEGLSTEKEKAAALYDFVTKRIKWNGTYWWTSAATPNKVLNKGTGTSGEMTMLLLALLHRAGIEAFPALVSLRGTGEPITIYPILRQFNHVLIAADLDGEQVILDPNTPSRPMGLPRSASLNGQVMVMEPDNPHWIDLDVPTSMRTVSADVTLDEAGVGAVKIQSRLKSYYALQGRNKLDGMDSEDEFPLASQITDLFPEAEVVSTEVVPNKKDNGDLSVSLELKVPMGDAIDDYLYVQPILLPFLEKELADTEVRLYPIDFNYPRRQRYLSRITLPEGYAVEELPQSIRVRNEDSTFTCLFSSSESNGTININFDVKIGRTVYQAGEYPGLRELFKHIIGLQKSTIVLKRAK